MALKTRLTDRLGLTYPIISAPMAFAAGGALAGAVSSAGGLGLIGGGYGDPVWLEAQFREAGNARVGCGFITWRLNQAPHVLDAMLAHDPAAVFLSFDDPTPYVQKIKSSGAVAIQQVQSLRDAQVAIAAGIDVIVAQGAEAGGHGEKRATMTLVPEVADLIAASAPDTLLCAAGGIADGRGLAAALMLGADGVVIGTRFWASNEALVAAAQHSAAITATGDDTVRQSVTDIARGYDWPGRFSIRVVRNAYVDQWLGREAELRALGEAERQRYADAAAQGDANVSAAIAGEAIGLIRDIQPAAAIVHEIVSQAEALLTTAPHYSQ